MAAIDGDGFDETADLLRPSSRFPPPDVDESAKEPRKKEKDQGQGEGDTEDEEKGEDPLPSNKPGAGK